MKASPRVKLVLLASLFLLPILASVVAYRYRPDPTANYGELLLPPATITSHVFGNETGAHFEFAQLRGRWILLASDSGACPAACVEKLAAMRQVRLALGRNATRVERVLVIDDLAAPDRAALAPFPGLAIAITPRAMALPSGATNDRAHIYLVDPRGNVMMRWPARAEMKRMHRDLDRLLKASQIG